MRKPVLFCIFLITLLINGFVWSSVQASRAHTLRVSVLDIGQGDSILVQGPTGIQMLVDGGPDSAVLSRLSDELGPIDRSLDMVVESHPDKDHVGGLPAVFSRYSVSYFMEPGIPDDTAASHAVLNAANDEPGITHLLARRGMRIDLGGGAYADVLYPDRDPSKLETNSGSVVLHVVYGATSFMLTGDLPSPQEDWLVALDGSDSELISDVLKAGHHGSKNSSDDAWLAAVHPSIVAISAGKDNSYGHPAPEAISRIENEGAAIYSTIDLGTLDFVSDGKTVHEN